MSTDTPDQLASSRDQALVLVATRAPGSKRFHEPSRASSALPRCNSFQYDGQLVPRWYAEDEQGRRPCQGCFPGGIDE